MRYTLFYESLNIDTSSLPLKRKQNYRAKKGVNFGFGQCKELLSRVIKGLLKRKSSLQNQRLETFIISILCLQMSKMRRKLLVN